jgi:hypothetical protein
VESWETQKYYWANWNKKVGQEIVQIFIIDIKLLEPKVDQSLACVSR